MIRYKYIPFSHGKRRYRGKDETQPAKWIYLAKIILGEILFIISTYSIDVNVINACIYIFTMIKHTIQIFLFYFLAVVVTNNNHKLIIANY